jgi:hydroxyacylglutathione hydrolase
MRLTPEVRLLASGDGGFSLSDPFDCHVYLVESRGQAALIDTGIGTSAAAIAEAIRATGTELLYVLLTHAHPDHSGGAAALHEAFPEAHVLASREVAGWVTAGDRQAMSIERGIRAELYPDGYRFRPCPGLDVVADGDAVRVGAVELRVATTPGHARGHLAFVTRGASTEACFCGDLVFYGGAIALEANWDCCLQEYGASVERLARERFEALLPGHHAVSLARGRRHVERAARQFGNGFVPRSIV